MNNGNVVQGITNVFIDFQVLINFQGINLVLKGIFQPSLFLGDYPEFVLYGSYSKRVAQLAPYDQGFIQVIGSTAEIGFVDINNGHIVVGLCNSFGKIQLLS